MDDNDNDEFNNCNQTNIQTDDDGKKNEEVKIYNEPTWTTRKKIVKKNKLKIDLKTKSSKTNLKLLVA